MKARTVLIAQRTDHYQNTLFKEEDHIFMFWQVEQRERILQGTLKNFLKLDPYEEGTFS